ncbi:NAD(P)-binding protein [Lenzites betulinus]|nr:NAD(P)-binding protein [Lenzites betulinus]
MSTSQHILLLGAHGKVALLMTPRILARGWSVTSVIRKAEYEADIRKAAAAAKDFAPPGGALGSLNVLIGDLEAVHSQVDAQQIIDKVKPTGVIYSAGAGPAGTDARWHQVDGAAPCAFIRASAATESVTTFLLVSAINSRRNKPSWWSDEEWAAIEKFSKVLLPPAYTVAKIAADECLTATARKTPRMKIVDLRPGSYSDDIPPEKIGRVQLGKTRALSLVSRVDVAEVAVRLFEKAQGSWKGGWVDLVSGEDPVDSAVEKWVKSGEDTIEGEDVDGMTARAAV